MTIGLVPGGKITLSISVRDDTSVRGEEREKGGERREIIQLCCFPGRHSAVHQEDIKDYGKYTGLEPWTHFSSFHTTDDKIELKCSNMATVSWGR